MASVIIPARWASQRFPGKPLADLGGKPVLQHVWERCRMAAGADRVIVATDDSRIAAAATAFGADVCLTRPDHPSGTDRIAEVARRLRDENLFVNVQGDEPFIETDLIDRLIDELAGRRGARMATAASPLARGPDFSDPNVVKVVCAADGRALYFSRAPIPHDRDGGSGAPVLRHQGIYAYTRAALLRIVRLPPSPLELCEKLEQLRALEAGIPIQVVAAGPSMPGIDTPAQLEAARAFLVSADECGRSGIARNRPGG